MTTILCLETATTNCSVAIARNGEMLDLLEENDKNYSHAEKLHVFIEQILTQNNLSVSDLDAVAVSKGPGSYTGLRIGVSAAKGLCFSLGLPLISVETLHSLALQVEESNNGIIIPMLDARRMEVYCAGFDSDMNKLFDTRAQVLDTTSFQQFLQNKKTIFIGSGVPKLKEICNSPNAEFLEEKLPSAAEMCKTAFEKFKLGGFEDTAYFEPFYLKDFMLG